jgi:hypothetical protein
MQRLVPRAHLGAPAARTLPATSPPHTEALALTHTRYTLALTVPSHPPAGCADRIIEQGGERGQCPLCRQNMAANGTPGREVRRARSQVDHVPDVRIGGPAAR